MKFFIPAANSEKQAEEVIFAVRAHLSKELGANFSDRRIASLHYTHNGKPHSAEVGKPDNGVGEIVIAILYEPERTLYHVCTPNRGVVRGMSILVGAHEVHTSVDFEKSEV